MKKKGAAAVEAVKAAAAAVTDGLVAIGERAGSITVTVGHLSAVVYPWAKQAPPEQQTKDPKCPHCGK